ncbi:MAG: TCP-1/cpn60 chaperonin family protein [Romboutsia timonensis]|uniref:TCP-1/cpn60 chaperonin family protein n=1 Tax=Romboutsia timonensis TaxID=1776391 RepID=UPI0039A28640
MGIYSNIVKKDKLREIQGQVLEEIRDALVQSYGPYGSNTLIYNDSTLNKYTKDGHEILSGIQILNEIEASVQRDLVQITNNTVRKVGDGTTAATILSSIIFKTFTELEGKYTPYKLMRLFDKTVKEITKNIMERNRVFDFNTAYKIAMISTNGNEKISKEIASIYEKYGNEVYIDVTITTQDRNVVKVYDGLSMSEGLYNSAYMNIPKENKADIRDCHVYYFDDQ